MNVFPRCGHERTPENVYRKLVTSKNGKKYPCEYCGECDRQRSKRRREAKPDYAREYQPKWRARHPEYARVYSWLQRRGISITRDRLTRAWPAPTNRTTNPEGTCQ